jgi:hypothetical protein
MNETKRFQVVRDFAGTKGGRGSSYMTFAEANREAMRAAPIYGKVSVYYIHPSAQENTVPVEEFIVEYVRGPITGLATVSRVGDQQV